ncbi:hypothetical protein QSX67_002619 [Vibrio cholerae]
MINLETRKGRPIQTKANILGMLHNEGITFQLHDIKTSMILEDGSVIAERYAQLQEIADLAARYNFYRDCLRQAINTAFGEIYTQLWDAIDDRPEGGTTFLKINSRLNNEQ